MNAILGGITKEEKALQRFTELSNITTRVLDEDGNIVTMKYPQFHNTLVDQTPDTALKNSKFVFDENTQWPDEFKDAWFKETDLGSFPFLLYSISGVQIGDEIYEKMLTHSPNALPLCKKADTVSLAAVPWADSTVTEGEGDDATEVVVAGANALFAADASGVVTVIESGKTVLALNGKVVSSLAEVEAAWTSTGDVPNSVFVPMPDGTDYSAEGVAALDDVQQKLCAESLWSHRQTVEQSILDNVNDRSVYGNVDDTSKEKANENYAETGKEFRPWLAQFPFQAVCSAELPRHDFLQAYSACWNAYLHGRDSSSKYASPDLTKAWNTTTTTETDENGEETTSTSQEFAHDPTACRVYQHFIDGPSQAMGGSFNIKNLRTTTQSSSYESGNHKYHDLPDYHALLTFPALPESMCPYDPEYCVWFPPSTGLDFIVVNHYKTNVIGDSATSDVANDLCQEKLCGGVVHPATRDTEGILNAATVARAHNVTFSLSKHGLLYDLEDEVPGALMDFYTAKMMFVVVSVVGCLLGTMFIGFMSVAIAPVVLFAIVGTFLLTVIGAVLVISKSGLCYDPSIPNSQSIFGSGEGETSCASPDTIFLTPASAQRTHLQILGLVLSCMVVAYLVACYWMAERIRLAIAIKESAMHFVREARWMFAIPFIQALFLFICWFFWLVTMAFLFADPVDREKTGWVIGGLEGMIAAEKNFDAQTWFRVGRAAPMRISFMDPLGDETGDNVIIDGIFKCSLPRVSLLGSIIYVFVLFFALLWLNSFVTAFGHCLISGIVGLLYFKRTDGRRSVFRPVLKVLFSHHIGSIAKGSMLFMTLKIFRPPLRFLHWRFKTSKFECELKMLECWKPLIFLYNSYVRFCNKQAYPQMVYSGLSLFESGKRATQLIDRCRKSIFTIHFVFLIQISSNLLEVFNFVSILYEVTQTV